MERRTGKIRRAFSRMHRALDGWMLARAPTSPTQGLHHHGPRYFNFPYFCTMCGLEKLGILLIETGWNVFVRFVAENAGRWVGDNNPSRSRLLSIWRKGGSMYRFVIGRCHRFSLSMEMSRLTRDGTAEPVSRDQILRHVRGQGNIIFLVQLTTSRIGNLTRLIHTLLFVMTIHT